MSPIRLPYHCTYARAENFPTTHKLVETSKGSSLQYRGPTLQTTFLSLYLCMSGHFPYHPRICAKVQKLVTASIETRNHKQRFPQPSLDTSVLQALDLVYSRL